MGTLLKKSSQQCKLTFRVFDKERLISDNSDVSSAGSTSLQTQNTELGLSSLKLPIRDTSSGSDESFRFRNLHLHREIPKLQQSTENLSGTTTTRQLVIEELPPLHKAAATGNVSEINGLLDEGTNVDFPLRFDAILSSPQLPEWTPMKFGGCTPLHLACWFGNVSSVKALLNRGADVLAQVPEYKFEALTFALLGRDPDSVFYPLVEKGARLQYKDINDRCPFITACASGKTFMIHYLLDHGADLQTYGVKGVHALNFAAFGGHEQAFEVLLDAGADIDPNWVIPPEQYHPSSTLHYAAMGGSVKIIKNVLRYGQDPNQVDSGGFSPLHWALVYGRLEASETLLEYTESPYTLDKEGYSTLHSAAFSSLVEFVELLIHHGADCNQKEAMYQRTSLHLACHRLNKGSGTAQELTVTLLLKDGAHVNAPDMNGDTPLHYAASGSNSKIAEILLDAGANALATSKYGATPLHYACQAGYIQTARLLKEHGAQVDACDSLGCTALHYSAMEGCAGIAVIAEMLLSGGASVHKMASDGATSLHYAAAKGCAASVQLFLDHGVDYEAIHTLGRTAFHSAARWGRTNCMDILLSHGAEVTAAPIGCKASGPEDEWQLEVEGCTPLICAAEHGHVAAVKLLLEHGAAVNVIRVDGKTALSCAMESGNIEIVQLLLNNSADIEICNLAGLTPLAQASRNSKCDIIKLLLAHGAVRGARDKEGRTAMHWAAFGGSESTVRILIEHGALLTPDHLGRTPLHDAVYNGNEPLVKLLLDHGADPMTRLAQGTTLACWTRYTTQKSGSVEMKEETNQNIGNSMGEDTDSVKAEAILTDQPVVRIALDIARSRGWISIMGLLVKD